VVLHSPSLRDRLPSTLNSTGLPISTTQEGLATIEKSVLVAVDIQLSSLHEPTSENIGCVHRIGAIGRPCVISHRQRRCHGRYRRKCYAPCRCPMPGC